MHHTPGEMELAHDKEMSSQGWSRWSIAALGADTELIPAIGMSLRHHFAAIDEKEPEWVLWLIRAGHTPEWYTNYPFSVYQREVEAHKYRVARSFWELAKLWKQFPEVIRELKDAHGYNPVQSLGHAMVWFGKTGTYDCGPDTWPYPYISDDVDSDYEQWKKDVIRHGSSLGELEDSKRVTDALVWLSKYYQDLCD
jgi:hypothetical protein